MKVKKSARINRAVAGIAIVLSLTAGALPANAAPVNAPVSSSVAVVAKKAAKPSVSIGKISTKTVAKGKKATIKPVLVKKGTTKIVSAKLSVTKGKKTVAKNKSSVSLGAGSYRVKTTVKYKLKHGKKWTGTWSQSSTQSLSVETAATGPKVNTTAGKKEVLRLINAKRKANGLKPLTLMTNSTKGVGKYKSTSNEPYNMNYSFKGSKWPTASEWLNKWNKNNASITYLYKDKTAAFVKIKNANPRIEGSKVNSLVLDVYSKHGRTWSDKQVAAERTRVIKLMNAERAKAKLPALKIVKGEPKSSAGQYWNGYGVRCTSRVDASTLRLYGLTPLLRDKKATHANVEVTELNGDVFTKVNVYLSETF